MTSISGEAESVRLIGDDSLIVEEKLDGTNVGIHVTASGQMVLQCRGHLITEGMHPQFDLFEPWVMVTKGMAGYAQGPELRFPPGAEDLEISHLMRDVPGFRRGRVL